MEDLKVIKQFNGRRKFVAFFATLICFTMVVIIVIHKMPNLVMDMSIFVVQLAMAYGIITGLFFGSNVLEHFSEVFKAKFDKVTGEAK